MCGKRLKNREVGKVAKKMRRGKEPKKLAKWGTGKKIRDPEKRLKKYRGWK